MKARDATHEFDEPADDCPRFRFAKVDLFDVERVRIRMALD